jgi:hypothetical protein
MSAMRLGPVIRTIELVCAAGLGRMVKSSSRPVRMRLAGTIAMCAGGRNEIRRASFGLERSFTLFAETLYDEVKPGEAGSGDRDLFSFDLDDSSAPHYPLRIRWSTRLQEFDPLQIPKGLFTEDEIRASYGEFLDGAMQLVEDAQP